MKGTLILKYLLFLVVLSPSITNAETYLESSLSLLFIDTPAKIIEPVLADFRFGYAIPGHQIEAAIMTGLADDDVNQLSVDVPYVGSVFYHYLPYTDTDIEIHLIVGASRVKVESSFTGIADAKDDFYGASYGIGFEESFESIPRLSLSIDYIRLYHGDDIDIDAASIGAHYVF